MEPPAISRADGTTKICPSCGTLEALASIPWLGREEMKEEHHMNQDEKRIVPAAEPEINEADGEPILHADEEEGEGDEQD